MSRRRCIREESLKICLFHTRDSRIIVHLFLMDPETSELRCAIACDLLHRVCGPQTICSHFMYSRSHFLICGQTKLTRVGGFLCCSGRHSRVREEMFRFINLDSPSGPPLPPLVNISYSSVTASFNLRFYMLNVVGRMNDLRI